MNHYILPTLHKDHPDVVFLHIGSNDINNQTKCRMNTEKLMGDIINIGKSWFNLGVKEVVISSILPKKSIALKCLIQHMNNRLRDQCILNGSGFISNDISRTHLWKNGIHFGGLGTNILARNFVDFLNRFILSESCEHSWLYTDKHLKGFYGNIGVLISDISLSSEIVSNISNLGSISSNWNSHNIKDYEKILLIQD